MANERLIAARNEHSETWHVVVGTPSGYRERCDLDGGDCLYLAPNWATLALADEARRDELRFGERFELGDGTRIDPAKVKRAREGGTL